MRTQFVSDARFSIGPEGKGIETSSCRRHVAHCESSALALKEKGLRPSRWSASAAQSVRFSTGPEGKGIET